MVSPLVVTESLWGVTLSVLLFKRSELVGVRLVSAAILVLAGGTLISVLRYASRLPQTYPQARRAAVENVEK